MQQPHPTHCASVLSLHEYEGTGEDTESFICPAFDPDALKVIRAHEGREAYMCRAPEGLPQTVHVHDGFHGRAIRRYCRGTADTKKETGSFRASLKRAMKGGDRPKFPGLRNSSVSRCSDEGRLKRA